MILRVASLLVGVPVAAEVVVAIIADSAIGAVVLVAVAGFFVATIA